MFKWFRNWRDTRRVKKMGFTAEQWEAAITDWPVMQRYQGAERDALRNLTFRFIARKTFTSGSGFQFSDAMCLKIATMACVPSLSWFRLVRALVYGDYLRG